MAFISELKLPSRVSKVEVNTSFIELSSVTVLFPKLNKSYLQVFLYFLIRSAILLTISPLKGRYAASA